MYFVHPQLKLNISNLISLFGCFVKKPGFGVLRKVERMFPGKEIYFTDMGRSAFRLIIEEFELQNSQMLVPSYICDVLFEIFKNYNIKPIFLDIEKETFNISADEIEAQVTPQTRSILICHTYGLPVNLEKILALTKRYKLLVIEDCAHGLGAKYPLPSSGQINSAISPQGGKFTQLEENSLMGFVGNFGDAAFFSLYKLFPTLRGGIAVLPQRKLVINHHGRDGLLPRSGRKITLPKTKFSARDFVSLLNCFSLFSFLFKRYASALATKHPRKEKLSQPAQLNRVSLNIFDWHLKNLKKTLEKRRRVGLMFREELKNMGFEVQKPRLRRAVAKAAMARRRQGYGGQAANNIFTFLSSLVPKNIHPVKSRKAGIPPKAELFNRVDRDKFVTNLRKKGVFLTRIWHTPIILNQKVQKEYRINPSQFPNTVEVAKRIVNFPLQNFYSQKDIKKMIEKIKNVLQFTHKIQG